MQVKVWIYGTVDGWLIGFEKNNREETVFLERNPGNRKVVDLLHTIFSECSRKITSSGSGDTTYLL